MGPLPPPPDHPDWGSAWQPSFAPLGDPRPAWRQGRPGWAIAHVAIGTGLTFVGLFSAAFFVALTGKNADAFDQADDGLVGLSFLLLYAGSVTGWICFAYARTTGRRWGLLAGIAGGSWLGALLLILQATS